VEAGYFSGANLLLINKVDDQGQRIIDYRSCFWREYEHRHVLMYVCD